MRLATNDNYIDFGGDPDRDADPGIFVGIFTFAGYGDGSAALRMFEA